MTPELRDSAAMLYTAIPSITLWRMTAIEEMIPMWMTFSAV